MGTDQSEGSGEGTCRLAPAVTEAAPVVTQEEKVGVGRQVHIQRWACGACGLQECLAGARAGETG